MYYVCYLILFFATILYIKYLPFNVKSRHPVNIDSHKYKIIKRRRLEENLFPDYYPNTWYFLCNSDEIVLNSKKTIILFDNLFVLFRNSKGGLGLVDAFCPHLGTNLGEGGVIKDDCIVCPYHSWEFNVEGKCEKIPYTTRAVPERANITKFLVIEKYGLIFMWYNDIGEKPPNNIKILDEIKEYHSKIIVKDYEDYHMHIMEPSQNSADYYHFKTVHKYLPNAFYDKLLHVDHDIHTVYENKEDGMIIIRESIKTIKFLSKISLPKFICKLFTTYVIIESPSLILFKIDNKLLGEYRGIMTLTPVEPFIQKIRLNAWGSGFFKIFGRLMTWFVMNTVEQDRRVWEHKLNIRNLVCGDGKFAAYMSWLNKFYSKINKINIKNLDW